MHCSKSISFQTCITTLNEFTAALPQSGSGAILDCAAARYHKSHQSRGWRVTPLSRTEMGMKCSSSFVIVHQQQKCNANPPPHPRKKTKHLSCHQTLLTNESIPVYICIFSYTQEERHGSNSMTTDSSMTGESGRDPAPTKQPSH